MIKHFTSFGKGKGIGTYWKDGFAFQKEICQSNYQMMKITSPEIDVINVYKSHRNSENLSFLDNLLELFQKGKKTLIVGDLNICYKDERDNLIVRRLDELGFKQLVNHPTHIEGRQLDHVYLFAPNDDEQPTIEVTQFGQYYTDHDLIRINITEVSKNSQI